MARRTNVLIALLLGGIGTIYATWWVSKRVRTVDAPIGVEHFLNGVEKISYSRNGDVYETTAAGDIAGFGEALRLSQKSRLNMGRRAPRIAPVDFFSLTYADASEVWVRFDGVDGWVYQDKTIGDWVRTRGPELRAFSDELMTRK